MNDKKSALEILALSGRKVFTINDLAVLWAVPERRKLVERLKYYLRSGKLKPVSKGVYAYGDDYSSWEVAQKLVPMSYISLYTASQYHGLSFQYYETVFSIALASKRMSVAGQDYVYHRAKEAIFYQRLGLMEKDGVTLADKERTICDSLYVFPGLAFDNLRGVDTEKLAALSRLYGNARLEREVRQLCSIVRDMN